VIVTVIMSVLVALAVAVVVDVIVVALTRELQTSVHTNARTAHGIQLYTQAARTWRELKMACKYFNQLDCVHLPVILTTLLDIVLTFLIC
jgi:hypothetical protein